MNNEGIFIKANKAWQKEITKNLSLTVVKISNGLMSVIVHLMVQQNL